MEIYCPPGNMIGTVNQLWGFCSASLEVKDENDVSRFKIVAPSCVCGHAHFDILAIGQKNRVKRPSIIRSVKYSYFFVLLDWHN